MKLLKRSRVDTGHETMGVTLSYLEARADEIFPGQNGLSFESFATSAKLRCVRWVADGTVERQLSYTQGLALPWEVWLDGALGIGNTPKEALDDAKANQKK